MPRYQIPLQANKPVRMPYPGKNLQIVDTGGAAVVNLEVEWGGDQQNVDAFGGVGAKFKLYSERVFSAITMSTTVNSTIDFLVSYVDVGFNPSEGVTVTASLDTSQFPLPVTVNALPAVEIDVTGGAVAVAVQPFGETGDRADLAVSVANARVAVGGAGSLVRVTNETDDVGLWKAGDNTVTAADADAMVVMPQSERIFAWPTGATHAAALVRAGSGGTFSFQRGAGV